LLDRNECRCPESLALEASGELPSLTPKEIVAKARLAMETARATTGDETAPAGSAVVGTRVLRSGDVVLQ
jgi:hypothetical protein